MDTVATDETSRMDATFFRENQRSALQPYHPVPSSSLTSHDYHNPRTNGYSSRVAGGIIFGSHPLPAMGRNGHQANGDSSKAPPAIKRARPAAFSTSREPMLTSTLVSAAGGSRGFARSAEESSLRRSSRLVSQTGSNGGGVGPSREKKRARGPATPEQRRPTGAPEGHGPQQQHAGMDYEASEDTSAEDEERREAERWLRETLGSFARAVGHLSRFESRKVVDEVTRWPTDLRTSWRAQMILGKARFEALEYEEVRVVWACCVPQPPIRRSVSNAIIPLF
jgi:hypothetical protein